MEYYWGYAAANAPLPNLHQRRLPAPTRSNSTKVLPSSKKSRFPGHRRTTSSDSARSRPSHEIPFPPTPPPLQQQQQEEEEEQASLGGTAAAPAAPAASSDERNVPRERMPASVAYRNKELPATPRLDTLEAASARYNTSNTAGSAAASPAAAVASGVSLSPAPGPAAAAAITAAAAPLALSLPLPPLPQQQQQRQPQPPTPSSATNAYGHGHGHGHGHGPAAYKIPSPSSPHAAADNRKHAAMLPEPGAVNKLGGIPFGRTESVSSNSAATTLSTRTMLSSEPPSSAEGAGAGGGGGTPSSSSYRHRPFVVRNGRTYLSDTSLPYPLPVDLAELHRQSLRTLVLFQLFGGPVCSPAFHNKPPTRVLEVGCGSGFWSIMCHRYFAGHGHSSISFTGIDVAPVGPGAGSSNGGGAGSSPASAASSDGRPDKNMKWRFVQHDMRRMPWPFADEEFDLVMVKDMSLSTTTGLQQDLMDEYLRVLRPGGTLEIWESDHTIRMLRPHVPEPLSSAPASASASSASSPQGHHHTNSDDEEEHAASIGAYVMTANTPLSAPLNNFLVEYNAWLTKALEARSLSPVPCTLIGPLLLQEAELLVGIGSRRLAVPLSEVKWEREGVGGVVTKDGKTYVETTKGKGRDGTGAGEQGGAGGGGGSAGRKALTAGQNALRRTALLTVVQLIQSLEPLLREVSGKSQDEWDGWAGKMMNDLMKEDGTFWGECLEVGAWWARKRK